MEYENVREALKDMYAISQTKDLEIKTYTKPGCETPTSVRKATVKDMQDIMFEVAVNIADLLGLEEIYLDEE